MKCFFKGILGAFLVLIAFALIIPMYGDYRSRAETSDWLLNIASTKIAISGNITRLNSLTNSGIGVKSPSGLRSNPRINITTDGVIFIQGIKYGQLLVIIPELSGTKVSWTCIGGSAKDVPPFCRSH